MKRIAVALLIVAFAACEKKPTVEEVEALEQAKKADEVKASAAAATQAPSKSENRMDGYANPLEKRPRETSKAPAAKGSPTPNNWLWKDYQNPLEKKPTPRR